MSGKHQYARLILREGLLDGLINFAQLESRISALPSTRERGAAFEAFAEAYLVTQKIAQAEHVWPNPHIPREVLRAHKRPSRDLGVDGVFCTWSGALNAYQVKFRTGRPPLTWEELATFAGLTDQVDQRVLFTNCDVLAEVMSQRSGFHCIRGSDLDRLTEADFSTMRDWLRSGRVQRELRTPDPHQVEAVTAIAGELSAHDRVTTVMACGTGKTMVALWAAEKTGCQRISVLVPSLALVRQTLHEWLKETRWERPRFLCVCSDPTVAPKNSDEVIVRQQDLDFPVMTDHAEVKAFMSNDGVRVVFTTYQSSNVVGAALEGLDGVELGIFDEAGESLLGDRALRRMKEDGPPLPRIGERRDVLDDAESALGIGFFPTALHLPCPLPAVSCSTANKLSIELCQPRENG